MLNKRNEEAFKVLYSFYSPKLLVFAKQYILNEEDAEEIIQDVFLKMWNPKLKIEVGSNINAFVYTVTRNACLDYLRVKKRNGLKDETYKKEIQINFNALADDASSVIIEKELESQINQALQLLPEKCRSVFVKSRYEGKRNREISEEMNISIKTVENHMTKALKVMRLQLRGFISLF